jgi:hypothetical protein
MPFRIVRERADDLEAVPLVERWRLERVSFNRELLTTVYSSLLLGRGQEATPNAPPAHVIAHPSASIQQVPPQLQP